MTLVQICGEECSFGGMEKVNPCDVDYKSKLSVASFDDDISIIWNSQKYNDLRNMHLNHQRKKITPCKSCVVI